MEDTTGERKPLGPRARQMLRVLIASFFMAGAIGIIPGTSLLPLTERLLPPLLADPVAICLAFGLAYMVMAGVWLRGAALLLGFLTFWASYMQMLQMGLKGDLGVFWRDLALIAALMLTYAEPDANDRNSKSLLRRVLPRRPPPHVVAPSELSYPPFRHLHGHERLSVEEMERIFHEDFEVARFH